MVTLRTATSKGNVMLIQSVEYLPTNTFQSWREGGGGREKLSVCQLKWLCCRTASKQTQSSYKEVPAELCFTP